MFTILRRTIFLALLLAPLALNPATAQEKAKGLSADDAKFLDGLLGDVLFDPKGAQRVKVTIAVINWTGDTVVRKLEGWLVKEKMGDRVAFADGHGIPAPAKDKIANVDFTARCAKLYDKHQDPEIAKILRALDELSRRETWEEPDLVLAAWLWRLGEKELAARVMQFIPVDREEERHSSAAAAALRDTKLRGTRIAAAVC